ncbi:MAG: VirK family protein [Candidatus Cloacimonetes bacterium]|nr:VirK family protein [Candidatus Cloacimonadota bacterium]
MRKAFLILFLWGTLFLYGKDTIQLKNFTEINSALEKGQLVRVIIHYGDCQLISNNEIRLISPRAVGGMTIDTYEYFSQNSIGNELAFLVASESKLIENPIGSGYVYNYAKIRIDESNKVRLIARYLDPVNFTEHMDESFYTQINDGKNGAAFFYILN